MHALLLLECGDQQVHTIKPFKFLSFWTEAEDFQNVLQDSWRFDGTKYIFIRLKQKIKNTKTTLSKWSKEKFGDIFKKLIIRKEIMRIKEHLFEESPNHENRMVMKHAQAELKKYLHYEEEY